MDAVSLRSTTWKRGGGSPKQRSQPSATSRWNAPAGRPRAPTSQLRRCWIGRIWTSIDIVTRDESHLHLVQLAIARQIPIICQKPLAADWDTAVKIVQIAESAGVRLMIHENWRWQPWHRVVGELIRRGDIGPPIGYGFRTRRRDGLGDFPYPLQSYFRDMPRLLIHETLVHHIDTARFLFGNVAGIYAQARRRNPQIAGEDQALLVLTHHNCVQGWIDGHRFLDTEPDSPLIGDAFFEGEQGCLQILPTGDVYLGTRLIWKNDVTAGYRGDSVRATQMHFISCLLEGTDFETSGRQYLHTFAAVEAAYRSIAERRQVSVSEVCCSGEGFTKTSAHKPLIPAGRERPD